MKPDETYVENHQSETYWKCDYIVYSLNLRKFRDNPVTQELLYKCRIPPGKFNHIFGLHICVPRKVKFQYYYNAFLKIYRFKSKDETLDTIPDNKTVYDMSPIDNLFRW